MLHIDLYNFEEPFAVNSKYIITSPRSLEACSRFGIKPVELLHKPLSYFENENSSYGTETDPSAVYQEYERHRLRKLRLCREERERLVREEEWSFAISEEQITSTPTPKVHRRQDESGIIETHKPIKHVQVSIQSDDSKTGFHTPTRDERAGAFHKPWLNRDITPAEEATNIANATYTKTNNAQLQFSARRNEEYDLRKSNVSKNRQPYVISEAASIDGRGLSKRRDHISMEPKMKGKDYHAMHETLRMNEIEEIDAEMNRLKKLHHYSRNQDHRGSSQTSHTSKTGPGPKLIRKSERLAAAKSEIQAKFDRWQDEFAKHVQHRNAEMLSRKIAEEERKEHQELKRQQQLLERDLLRRTEHVHLSNRLSEAEKIKEFLRLQRQVDLQGRNEEEREKHEMQMSLLQRENRKREAMIRREIAMKQQTIERNTEKMMTERAKDTAQNRMKEEERRVLQQEQLGAMEKDLKRWQDELIRYQEQSLRRAQEIAKGAIREKSIKAHEQRLQKEMDHALNKSKVDSEDYVKREELLMTIEMKDKKSQIVVEDKQNFINNCRQSARASSAMRDSRHERAIRSSFDKMASEAERLARLDRRVVMN